MKNATEKYEEKFKIMDLQYTAYESTESLKRRTIPYKKLVVPLRMRSVYWKYFGFPASDDGSIITKDKIVCILCKNQMIYNRNTSNLRMHLTSRHKNVMTKIDPSALIPTARVKGKKAKSGARSNSNDSDYEYSGMGMSKEGNETKEVLVVSEEGNDPDISNIAIIFPNEVVDYHHKETEDPVESNEITDTIVNFIITDLIAPDVVDGKGFHCLMSNVSNKAVVIPNEEKLLNDIIPTMFNSCKDQLYSSMHVNAISNLSLSMEEWTCADKVKCISIFVHFCQNADACLHTRLLTTVSYTGTESISYWTTVLDRLLHEWNINVNYVTAVIVSFDNEDLLKAIKAKNLITVPCFLFTIQQLCNEYFFYNHQIAPILEKCRKLVKYLQNNRIEFRVENPSNTEPMEDDDDGDEDESLEHSLCLDRQELWLTTYYMLKNLVRKKNAMEEAVLNLDVELLEIMPDDEEWKKASDMVKLMEPLKTIVITLFEEKNSLISLLKPLVWKVNTSKFELKNDDSKLTQELKQHITNALSNAYGEQEVHNLTQIATILDPRFKNFVQQDGSKHNIETTLVELLTDFVNAEGTSSPRLSTSDGDRTPVKRSSRISGINSLLGNICANKPMLTLEDKINAEVTHYLSKSTALLEECPLDWWRHVSNKCPNLSRLANRYHCVPAIITRTGNYSVHDYLKFHRKRSVLNVNIADALLFLHSNKTAL